jgi:hypothetical protein
VREHVNLYVDRISSILGGNVEVTEIPSADM